MEAFQDEYARYSSVRYGRQIRTGALKLKRRLTFSAVTVLLAIVGAPSGHAAEKQMLVLGQGVPISQLTPVPIYQVTMPWVRAIYDTLIVWEDGEPGPGLAASWEISDDYSVYTLKLQTGVSFHDGKSLTPQIVLDNLNWAADPKNRVNGSGVYVGAEFSSPSPDTVQIKFARATPQALSILALMPVVDLTTDLATAPNGTGPYKVSSFASGSSLTLTRNESYWNASRAPELPLYEIRILADNAAAMAALVSGQIDGIAYPDFRQLASLKTAGIALMAQKPSAQFVLRVNASKGPLADKRVRQALSAAIQRSVFADRMVGGYGDPTCSPYPKASVVYDTAIDADCTFDLEKAKRLLTEAGHETGLELNMLVSSVRQPEWAAYAPLLQEDLGKIGVKLNLLEVAPAVMQQNVSSGDYELQGVWYGWGSFDPALLFVDEAFAPNVNTSWFRDPEYQKMVDDAQAEPDQDGRLEKYRAINRYLVDQAFMIPVSSRPYIYAVRPSVSGFSFDPFGMAYVNKTHVTE